MRKHYTLIAVICCIVVTANAQIPNAGFEDWTAGNPDGWVTSNAFPAGLVNVTQSSDARTGSSALQGSVVNFFNTPLAPVTQSGPGGTGFSIAERYLALELYYKFTSVGEDKFSVNVELEKEGSTIAQGAVALPQSHSSYTHLVVPMSYTVTGIPDKAIIQISITGPVVGHDAHIGSVMVVDDLSFSMSIGINNENPGMAARKCYPSPAIDFVNIPFDESVSGDVVVHLFDSFGREIRTVTATTQMTQDSEVRISVADLPSGLYLYALQDRNGQCCGKFMVERR